MRKENIYLIVVILTAVVGGLFFFFSGKSVIKTNKEKEQREVIFCLLENKARLYISSNCNYCLEQKEIFGDYFSELDYVDCEENGDWLEICKKANINSVPTWVFPVNLESPKEKIISCFDCQKRAKNFNCDDYCYTESEDGKFLKISGVLDINKIVEIFGCKK